MKKFIMLAVAVFFLLHASAQNLQWATTINNTYNDYIYDIHADAEGSLYICGQFELTVDFDPGPGVASLTAVGNGQDIFIAKYDTAGNYLWAHSFGTGFFYDHATRLASDPFGNVYMTGFFGSTVDFDPDSVNTFTLTASSGRSRFLLKLDKDGNFVHAKKVGNAVGSLPSSQDSQTGLECDGAGNVYMCGFYGTTLMLDTGAAGTLSVSGLSDNYFCKYDSSLVLQWANRIGSNGTEYSQGMYVSDEGKVIALGSFSGTVDFDPDTGTFLMSQTGSTIDGYFAMYDTDGKFIFARHLEPVSACTPRDVTMDSRKNIILTGSAMGMLDADPGPGVATIGNGFNDQVILCAYDSLGNYRWAFAYGDINAYNAGHTVATDSADNIYIVGNYEAFVDLDPGPDTAVYPNPFTGFVALYDTGGNYRTSFISHTSQAKFMLRDGAIYMAGNYYNVVDFDPGPATYNMMSDTANASWYLLKLDECNDYPSAPGSLQVPALCKGDTVTVYATQGGPVYEWTFSPGLIPLGVIGDSVIIYVDTVASAELIYCRSIGGCISSAFSYITVSVNDPQVPVITEQNDTLFSTSAVFYQWYLNGSPISGATDSIHIPAAFGIYSVLATDSNGCQSFSDTLLYLIFSIHEQSAGNPKVYPNPFDNSIHIHFGNISETVAITLRDILGKTVMQFNVTGTGVKDTGSLPSGVYFLEWESSEKMYRKKVIKMR